MAHPPIAFNAGFLLFDSTLSAGTLRTLQAHGPKQWYAGEANPAFIQKIPELRTHPLSSEQHREQVHQRLPAYGQVNKTAFLDEDDDENNVDADAAPCRLLSLLLPQGELSLAFAGPCIALDIDARIDSADDQQRLLEELDKVRSALASVREYHILNREDPARWLTWNELRDRLITARNRAAASLQRAAATSRRSVLLFWAINGLLASGLIWLLVYGVQELTRIQAIDTSRQFTFIIQQKVNAAHRVVLPDFQARGTILETGETTTLKLYRDEFIRVQPGNQLTVLRNSAASPPYVLGWYVEKHSPFQIGPIKINIELIVWLAFGAGWVALLYNYRNARYESRREYIRSSTISAVIWCVAIALLVAVAISLRANV